MNDVISRYKTVDYPIPGDNLSWLLYGAGFECFGKDEKPVRASLPELKDDEILVRVDAVGLCFSDVKLITQGSKHPRVYGRDLKEQPAVPGHEASFTVVKVGKARKNKFKAGERYLIHVDVYYKGTLLSFGYYLPGAFQQYIVLGKEILDGDEGCYLLPIKDTTGYAEAGLSEPWACVLASYRIPYRKHMKAGGTAWVIADKEAKSKKYIIDETFIREGIPAKVILSGVRGSLKEKLTALSAACGFSLTIADDFSEAGAVATQYTSGKGFDDIIIFGTPGPELVESIGSALGKGGFCAIIAENPVSRKVQIDVERIHYGGFYYTGTKTSNVADAYRKDRDLEYKLGGKTLIIGAGGPMGQMHVQRACEAVRGPKLIVATDIDDSRLAELKKKFSQIAEKRGARLVTLNPAKMEVETYKRELDKESGNGLFDEVVVLAPSSALIGQGAERLGEQAILNVFAGVPKGTQAMLDINGCFLHGHQWIGSSGSRLVDFQSALEQTQTGELSPNQSVAAISGINAVLEGLKAVKGGKFPGKVVIWPQLPELPLIPLPELHKYLPDVARKLASNGGWTKEAEEELLRSQLHLPG